MTVRDLIGGFILAALAAAIIAALTIHSKAHTAPSGWRYPSDCCDDVERECAPIPASAAQLLENGNYQVILLPGQHPNVKVKTNFIAVPGQFRHSGDGEWHACIRITGMQLDCLIIPLSS